VDDTWASLSVPCKTGKMLSCLCVGCLHLLCVRAGLVTVLMYVSERVSEPIPTHQVYPCVVY